MPKKTYFSALRLAVICDLLTLPDGILSLRNAAANPGTRFIVVNKGLGVLPVRKLLLYGGSLPCPGISKSWAI